MEGAPAGTLESAGISRRIVENLGLSPSPDRESRSLAHRGTAAGQFPPFAFIADKFCCPSAADV